MRAVLVKGGSYNAARLLRLTSFFNIIDVNRMMLMRDGDIRFAVEIPWYALSIIDAEIIEQRFAGILRSTAGLPIGAKPRYRNGEHPLTFFMQKRSFAGIALPCDKTDRQLGRLPRYFI